MTIHSPFSSHLTAEEINRYKELSAFGALFNETIKLLIFNGEQLEIAPGETLFAKGDNADNFYIILDGSVGYYQDHSGKSDLVREYLAGDQIGVSAMITLNVRQGDGIAWQQPRVLKVTTSLFHQLYLNKNQDFTLLVLNMFRDMARGLKLERENL